MRRVARYAGLAALVGAMAIAVVISVNAQRGPMSGGPPGDGPPGGGFPPMGMMMGGNSLESSWAEISFSVGASDEALVQIRKLYKEEWDALRELREQMRDMDQDGRRQAMTQMEESHTALLEQAKELLTPEQAKKLEDWHREQVNRRQQWSQRAPTGSGPNR